MYNSVILTYLLTIRRVPGYPLIYSGNKHTKVKTTKNDHYESDEVLNRAILFCFGASLQTSPAHNATGV